MKNLFYTITLNLIILLNVSFSYGKIPDIVLNQKRAVVSIYINDKDGKQISTGTGFIIDSNGIIATNYHVISAWLKADNVLIVKMENGSYFPSQFLIGVDEENDVAIFKVDGKELPIIKLSKNFLPKQGEKIVVVGSPLGLETTVSDGIISSIRGKDGVIQITAPISPGSSGSPVLNSNGEAIGVASFLIKGGQNLNFAISVKHVANLVKKSTMTKQKGLDDEKPTEALPPSSALVPATPSYPDINLEKAAAFFAEKNYKEAIKEYVSIHWALFEADKNHPKLPSIQLQIAKAFIETGDDMPAWRWLKFLKKEYPGTIETFAAKNLISSKRWFHVGDTDRLWFIDASSITPIDDNNIRVLVKTVFGMDNKTYSDVTNQVYDCILGRSAAVGLIKYDSDGNVTETYDFSDDIQWISISPDSIGETIWNTVCEKE